MGSSFIRMLVLAENKEQKHMTTRLPRRPGDASLPTREPAFLNRLESLGVWLGNPPPPPWRSRLQGSLWGCSRPRLILHRSQSCFCPCPSGSCTRLPSGEDIWSPGHHHPPRSAFSFTCLGCHPHLSFWSHCQGPVIVSFPYLLVCHALRCLLELH